MCCERRAVQGRVRQAWVGGGGDGGGAGGRVGLCETGSLFQPASFDVVRCLITRVGMTCLAIVIVIGVRAVSVCLSVVKKMERVNSSRAEILIIFLARL